MRLIAWPMPDRRFRRRPASKAAAAEKKARDQAEKNEQAAKVQSLRAEQGEEAARKNLLETQQTLFTAQIARSAGLWQSDPYQGSGALLRSQCLSDPES